MYYLCTRCEFQKTSNLSDVDMFVLALTSAIHDFEHGALNNAFLSKIKDPLALRYNDIPVLENHHVAAAFSLL